MIILTGANGQLGQEFMAHEALFGKIAPITRQDIDYSNQEKLLEAFAKFNPSYIINCAGYTAVDKAESEPKLAHQGNMDLPAQLGWVAKMLNIPLIHFSTDYVFDGEKQGAYVEADPTNPKGEYGRTKLKGEHQVELLHAKHFILRTAWVYSAYGNNFLKTMLRLSKEREELRVVGDQWGNPTACIDIVLGTKAIIDTKSTAYGIYHLAGKDTTSWHGFASEIVAHGDKKPKVISISTQDYPTPAKRPKNSVLSNEKFIKTFGFTPKGYKQRIPEILKALNS